MFVWYYSQLVTSNSKMTWLHWKGLINSPPRRCLKDGLLQQKRKLKKTFQNGIWSNFFTILKDSTATDPSRPSGDGSAEYPTREPWCLQPAGSICPEILWALPPHAIGQKLQNPVRRHQNFLFSEYENHLIWFLTRAPRLQVLLALPLCLNGSLLGSLSTHFKGVDESQRAVGSSTKWSPLTTNKVSFFKLSKAKGR